MAQVSLDMYQTLAIAVVALLIGAWLKTKIKVLDRLCIPSPVVGGRYSRSSRACSTPPI